MSTPLWIPPEDEWTASERMFFPPVLEIRRKERCRIKTRKAIKETGFQKPPCVCGETAVQIHHIDYSLPFVVAFLCQRCHAAEHGGRLRTPFDIHDLSAPKGALNGKSD